jgi:hypothetical protein
VTYDRDFWGALVPAEGEKGFGCVWDFVLIEDKRKFLPNEPGLEFGSLRVQ